MRAGSIKLINLFRRVAKVSPDIKSDYKQLKRSWHELEVQLPAASKIFPIMDSKTASDASRIEGQALAKFMCSQAKVLCQFVDAVIKNHKDLKVKIWDLHKNPKDPSPYLAQGFMTNDYYEFYKFTDLEDQNKAPTNTSYFITDKSGDTFSLSIDSQGKYEINTLEGLLPDLGNPRLHLKADSFDNLANARVELRTAA